MSDTKDKTIIIAARKGPYCFACGHRLRKGVCANWGCAQFGRPQVGGITDGRS